MGQVSRILCTLSIELTIVELPYFQYVTNHFKIRTIRSELSIISLDFVGLNQHVSFENLV